MLFNIVVIGAGGTGSLFLGDFCRFLSTSSAKDLVQMVVIDGDTIEEKNLSRQAFVEDEIGRNKADAMAEALNDTFDLSVSSLGRYIETPEEILEVFDNLKKKAEERPGRIWRDEALPVIISCVDNVACRLQMEEVFRRMPDCYYIDSGNGYDTGQCVYALKRKGKVLSPMRDHYNLFYDEEKAGDTRSRTQMSCEELNQAEPQHILTNRMAALNIVRALILLTESGGTEFVRGLATFDAFKGTSSLLLPEELGFEAIKEKPKKRATTRPRKKKEEEKAS